MSTNRYAQYISEQQQKLRGRGLVSEASKAAGHTIKVQVPHGLDFQPAFSGDTSEKQNARIAKIANDHGLHHTMKKGKFDGMPTTDHTLHVPHDHPKYKQIMSKLEKEDIYPD